MKKIVSFPVPQWITVLLLAAVAILCYIPFSSLGFTCGDDLENYLITRQGWAYCWEHAQQLAAQQGRFYFLLAHPCYDLAWAIDDWGYTHALQYGTLLLSYLLFSRLLMLLFRSQPLAYLVLLLLVILTPITANNHMPFMAYPFVFAFSCSLMWGALIQYLRYCRETKRWRLLLSALLFFAAALFYETYILFILLLCLFIVARYWRKEGFLSMWQSRSFYTELLTYVGVILIYMLLYIGYRAYQLHLNPEAAFYAGASVSDQFSWAHFFRILGRCTRIVLPMQNFHYYHEVCTLNYPGEGAVDSALFALTHAPLRVYILALLVGVVGYGMVRGLQLQRWTLETLLWAIAIAIGVSFLAHTLIGITPKYNNEWYLWMRGYVTSYFSYFGITMAVALLGVLMLWLLRSHTKLLQWAYLGIAVVLMVMTIIVGYANENLSREWQRSESRFDEIDRLSSEGLFQSLPTDAILYTEDLYSSSVWGSTLTKENDYIDQYIVMRSGRTLQCANSKEQFELLCSQSPQSPIYHIQQIEMPQTAQVEVSIQPMSKSFNNEINN